MAKKAIRKNPKDARNATDFLKGCRDGGGVLYRIFVTASSAVLDLGRSIEGNAGGGTLYELL